jgi:mycothiol system anti-sigma-R factor
MAFSEPTDGQCSDVLRDVWAFLDDELDPGARAAVQRHLDECSPCLEEAGLDAKLKHILHAKCGGERAPEHLRVRLVARIATISAALNGDDVTVQVVAETVTLSGHAERTDPP